MNTRTRESSSRLLRRFLIFVGTLVMVAGAGAQVAPVETLVQDTLYRADGSAAQGNVTLRWNGFSTSAGQAVAAGEMTVTTNASGGISIPLIANTGSTPSGSYYRVVIKLDDGTTSEEMWVVPAATTTTVAAIRAKVVPQAVAAQFVSRDYVDSSLATVVHLAGAETIEGVKTFVPSPEVPVPSDAGGAANKGYVDQSMEGLATVASTGNYNDLVNRPATTNLAAPGAIGASTPGPVNATVYTVNGTPLASANLSDGALLARTSTTINGYPISSNVSLSVSNLTPGALPNGTTATTQTGNDNSTKVATTQYVTETLASPPGIGGTAPGTVNATAYAVNGTPLASGSLSDAATLARNNAANAFTTNQLINYSGGDGVSPLAINASASGLSNQHGLSVNLPSTGNRRAIGVVNGTDAMSWFSLNGNVNGTGDVGFELGLGASSARDTFLYRSGAGMLSTPGSVAASTTISATSPVIDPRASVYGAKCDGVTDDTAALQAALNAADLLSGGSRVFIPGQCEISAALTVATSSGGFEVVGNGPNVSKIEQMTSNTPVIQITAGGLHNFKVEGIAIGHQTSQPNTNTNAVGILVGGGSGNPDVYNSSFRNLIFYNSFRGIQESANAGIWGTSFDQIWGSGGGSTLSGATLWLVTASVGSVRDSFTHIYNAQTISEPQVNIQQCYGCTVTNLESDNGLNTIFKFGAFEGSIRDVNIEVLNVTTPSAPIIQVDTCKLEINGIWMQNNNTINVGSGNNAYLINNDSANSFIHLDRVNLSRAVITSGSFYVGRTPFQPAAGGSLWDIGSDVVLGAASMFPAGDDAVLTGTVQDAGVTHYTNPIGKVVATSGANVNSDPQYDQGSYWNGAAGGLDIWTHQVVEGTGANPTSTYTFTHSGSTGVPALAAPYFSPRYSVILPYALNGYVNPSLSWVGSNGTDTSTGFVQKYSQTLSFVTGGNSSVLFSSGGLRLPVAGMFGWSPNTDPLGGNDTNLMRLSPGVVCVWASANCAGSFNAPMFTFSSNAGLSWLGAASIALGNGTYGDASGSLQLATRSATDNTTFVATTAQVQAAIISGLSSYLTATTAAGTYAPLASPTFTGVPAAPTATAGTNTTQLATTAFVANAVAAVTGGSAPLDSPAFTGTPTAPTAAASTNTTQIATTAQVQAAITAAIAGLTSSGFPATVYNPVPLTGQSASIAGSGIYTVPVTGTYRINYSIYTTTVGTGGTVSGTFGWDIVSGTVAYFNTASVSLTTLATAPEAARVIHAVAGTNITFSTTVAGATGSPQYGVDIVIERLK